MHVNREKSSQQNDCHGNTRLSHESSQENCQTSQKFHCHRCPCCQLRRWNAKCMKNSREVLRPTSKFGIAVRHEAVSDNYSDRQSCPPLNTVKAYSLFVDCGRRLVCHLDVLNRCNITVLVRGLALSCLMV